MKLSEQDTVSFEILSLRQVQRTDQAYADVCQQTERDWLVAKLTQLLPADVGTVQAGRNMALLEKGRFASLDS